MQRIFWKRRKKVLRLPQKKRLSTPVPQPHVTRRYTPLAQEALKLYSRYSWQIWMSPNATPATQNEATEHWKAPKVTTFAELAIGTAIRTSHGHLRTVADGCERLRNVERTHPQPPDPQSETGTLATHSGKTISSSVFILGGSSQFVNRLVHPSYKWNNPTYPIYNQAYNLPVGWTTK